MPVLVDSSFLILLGDSESDTREANRLLQNDGFDVFCTNTALVELGGTAMEGRDREDKRRATVALNGLANTWRIKSIELSGVKNGIADNIAGELQRLFPSLSYHGALALGEAAALDDFSFFVTWDPQLLALDKAQLALFLSDRCQNQITVISPEQIVLVLRKKLERQNDG